MLKHYAHPIPSVKFNESELRADFPNGARVQLFGADNPDALRGIGLWGVIFDEYSQQPSSIFTEVIRPALADHKGYAVWLGTPKGMNDFYRLYNDHKEDSDWYVKLLKASESEILDEQELQDARKEMSFDEYNQEFECSFTAAIKGAYYSKQLEEARAEKRITGVPYEKDLAVETWWDLGISDTTSIIFTQTVGKEIHVIDYYQNNNAELAHYARVLKEKKYLYKQHNLPHDIKVRELQSGRSRLQMLRRLVNDPVKTVKMMPIKDGIEAARVIFNKCWFDKKKTEELVDALSQYTQEWDDKKGMFKEKPLHNWASHPADAFRMLAVGYREQIDRGKSKGYGMSKYKGTSTDNLIKKLRL